MTVEDLLHLVPNLITKVDSLETELKQTKLTMGNAIVKLVKKVKKLEDILKRRHVVLTDSEDEEPEDQGRIIQDINNDPIQGKAKVKFEAQHYTKEDWDAIRAKLEANAELTKSVLGKELPEEDFAKKMDKEGTWKLTQLKKLSFEEVKEEFDKLVKQKQRIDDNNVSDTKEKVGKVKEEEPVKRVGKRKKQKAGK
ncbi:hypothetical protein Tco_0919992, partial [Tanacetum coccineum]